MRKIFSTILGLTILFSFLSVPVFTQAISSTSTMQELIISLQDQINQLRVQIETLRQAQSEVKEIAKEVKGTLQLINQLRIGMTSEEVKRLQEILATDPDVYPEGLITGYFGRLTEKAVKKFQKKVCLEQVGLVGPKTLWKINELLTEGAGASGKIPPGLLTAPGIQKKLCATSTPDIIAPIISAVFATSTTATSTQITWLTDEKANSKVWYSTSTSFVITTSTPAVSSSDYVLIHNLTLSNLTASTTYYYLISSADKSGNIATTTEKLFTTLNQ